ncbi:MAG TPA: hypothetical protein DHV59_15800 [Oxalobacteraceae bacterium]|nr:hypothetical protein [Oxalobacteraceae bacterium]
MRIPRLIRHLLTTRRQINRHFSQRSLNAIQSAIQAAEASHLGEICFAVEAALAPIQVFGGVTPHQRAIEVFGELRVWDTDHNSGVLIYVLLADKAVEVIADRGIHRKTCHDSVWRDIVDAMQEAFASGRFESGALQGIAAVSAQLTRHFPASGANANELPDHVHLL